MTFTTDPTTDIGLIRMRISDRDSTAPIFSDDDLTAFLAFEGDSLRASAAALEAIAVNQALVLKVIKLLQLSTDGAKLAETLLKLASRYRDQAEYIDAASGGTFDVAEFVDGAFAERERLIKEALRTGI